MSAPAERAVTSRSALYALTRHAVRGFARNPIAAFFTLAFPLALLIIVASIIGDQRTADGVPIAQYLVSPFAVFGVAQASFVLVAADMAALRERGVLLRLRAAPIPVWTVPASRIVAAVVASGLAMVVTTVAGVLGYDVQIIWRKVPAMVVTLVLGIACCAALGLALAALARTAAVAQSLAQGLLITLAYVSDVFLVGAALPRWMQWLGSALPLKHFARAMAETFDPAPGYGFSPGHLIVLVAWGVAGVVVAGLRSGWQPRGAATPQAVHEPDFAPLGRLSPPVRRHGSPLTTLSGQISYALLGQRRDPLAMFFSVIFPALLLALFPTVFGDGRVHGMTLAQYLYAGMIAYTAALTAYVNLPESVVTARAAGVLKRLRGTPLPFRWYFAGRAGAALTVSLAATVLLTVVGTGFLHVRLDPVRIPALLLAIVAGSVCFAALGLAIAALMPAARSIVAVTLGTLLPLCFASEIFVVGDQPLPGWLTHVAGLLPLRHLLRAVLAATDPSVTGAGFATGSLAVLAAWTGLGLLVVARHRDALS
ncbi:ABC transporter permease [Actinoplanes sp. NPDC020271]|uniref:ABC transporter permease n=1 Tax=Actinoplanes sp. NPDC020271 TaxID=3363896 RepID=UPI0037995E21